VTGKERPLIVGVTVAASTTKDLHSIRIPAIRLRDQVKRPGDLTQSAGLDGVVCSV